MRRCVNASYVQDPAFNVALDKTNQTNQINQTNQMNEIDEKDETDETDETDVLTPLARGSPEFFPKLGSLKFGISFSLSCI